MKAKSRAVDIRADVTKNTTLKLVFIPLFWKLKEATRTNSRHKRATMHYQQPIKKSNNLSIQSNQIHHAISNYQYIAVGIDQLLKILLLLRQSTYAHHKY